MSRKLLTGLLFFSVISLPSLADDHGSGPEGRRQANETSKSAHPEAQGKVIHMPPEVQTLEQFKEFIKTHVPKGSEPMLLLSGEEWCPNCVKLAPRLKGKIPASKVILEIDTSQDDPKKNILVNAIAKSKKFMKEGPNNELK